MNNFKTIFSYMVVGALVAALSISCKSNEEPKDTGSTNSNHPAPGAYTNSLGNSATVTINNDGTCTITGTAKFNNTETENFSITVTKWWYYYDAHNINYAGINSIGTEKSEATINSPATDYLYVTYNSSSGELWIVFGPEGKRYYTGNLTKG